MTATQRNQSPGMKFYVVVWLVLILIAGIEVFVTYQHPAVRELLAIVLVLAVVEAGIALMYFMHLRYERPILFWSLIPALLFVLFMMDHIWPDALRLQNLRVVHW
jgi:cytochrome c oxidase subunit IV